MKKNIFKVLVGLVFLVAFNVLFFFLGGTERTTTEWISYGFIHFAYLCILLTPLFCKNKKGRTVLNASLYLRALIYFIIALIAGIAFIAWNPEEILWPTIVQAVIATTFLIMQLMSVTANEVTDESLERQSKEKVYIQELASNIREAMQNAQDPEVRKKLRGVYEVLNNASTGSCPEAEEIELQLAANVNALCMNAPSFSSSQIDNSILTIKETLRKRNAIINKSRFS